MSASNEDIHTDIDGHGTESDSDWREAAEDAEYHDDAGYRGDAGFPEDDLGGSSHDGADHDDTGYPEPPEVPRSQPGAPWKRSRNRMEFSGDAAAARLRNRLSMAPDRIAEPPPSEREPSSFGGWRLTGAAAVVVVGVGGYLWAHGSNTAAASRDIAPAATAPAPKVNPAPEPPRYATASYETQTSPPPEVQPTRTRSLTLPIPSVPDTVTGTSALSPAPAPAKAPAPGPLRRANSEEVALMMKQGQKFMDNADVSGARLVFQRAAEAGEPAAALALAETYDPAMLGTTATRAGLIADVAAARGWYERAKELGSPVASERIARLDEVAR